MAMIMVVVLMLMMVIINGDDGSVTVKIQKVYVPLPLL